METVLILSSVLLWVVVLLNLLLTLGLVRQHTTNRHPASLVGLKAGQPIPDFSAQTLSGGTVTRSTFAGRSVAFLFISTHCGPCREILPRLEQLGLKATQADVEFVLVSGDELEETRAFVDEMNIGLPVLIAPRESNPFMEDYKATVTPSYCLVNEQGNVQSAGYPGLDGGEWKTLADSWTNNTVSSAAS